LFTFAGEGTLAAVLLPVLRCSRSSQNVNEHVTSDMPFRNTSNTKKRSTAMKKILSTLTLLVFSAFTLVFAQWTKVTGSGNITKQTRSISGFTSVTVSGSIQAVILPSADFKAEIETDDNIQQHVVAEVKGGKLVLGYAKNIDVRPSKKTVVTVWMPKLDAAVVSGSGSITGEQPLASNGSFDATISGSGKIALNIKSQETEATISGSGSIALTGQTDKLEVQISGSGSFKGFDHATREAEVKISGSGNVETTVNGKIDARISGSGSVLYKGTASVDLHASGSGKVKKVD
jgi:hypothetical protein